jgi:acetyl-CoA carboxylase biotin carboxyl carrier protein
MAGSQQSTEKTRLELQEIQKLIKMIEKSPITEFELVEKDLRIRISKNGSEHGTYQMMAAQPMSMPVSAPQVQMMPSKIEETPEAKQTKTNLIEIKSPMVGTFYRAPSPDADPYVRVGDLVEPGKALCIVEAMKLMNEIECEVRGRIVEILVENAHPVEFGQVLFRVDSSAA